MTAGAAHSCQEIIPAVLFVDVRGFDPFGTGFLAIPDNISGPLELEGFRIQLVQIDAVMAFIQTFLTDEIAYIPQRTVIIKEKAGINAVSSFYYNRVAPWACRILGSDHIIVSLSLPSFGNEGIDDIKGSLVVTDTGSP